jgi:tetratricopeptide (TPR) repeat protein
MKSAPGPRPVFFRMPLLCVALGIAASSYTASAVVVDSAATHKKTDLAAIEENVKAGHFAQAAEALAGILQADPHAGPDVYRLLAFSEFKLGNSSEALTTCERGLPLYPGSYPGSRPLAELYVSVLRQDLPPEERQSRLVEISKQVPNSPVLLKAMGEELMDKDPESTQALGFLSSAVKLSPQDPEAHFFYGEAACFNKQDAVCIRELTRAHELSPANKYANMQLYTMIAVAEDRSKHPTQAAEAFARSLRANEQLPTPNPYAALKYVTFLTAQGKNNEATTVIDEILKWDSSYGPAHFELAKMLAQQGRAEDAAKEAELALQDSRSAPPDLRAYHAFLAKTYFALGRESDAQIHQAWIESHQAAGAEP